MMEQLDICPLCGVRPKGATKYGGSDERHGYNFSMRIECACGLIISRPSHRDKYGWCDDSGQAERAVIAAWNKRAER